MEEEVGAERRGHLVAQFRSGPDEAGAIGVDEGELAGLGGWRDDADQVARRSGNEREGSVAEDREALGGGKVVGVGVAAEGGAAADAEGCLARCSGLVEEGCPASDGDAPDAGGLYDHGLTGGGGDDLQDAIGGQWVGGGCEGAPLHAGAVGRNGVDLAGVADRETDRERESDGTEALTALLDGEG